MSNKNTTLAPGFWELVGIFKAIGIPAEDYFNNPPVIKLDDQFARSHGFDSMEDIYTVCPELQGYEWLDTKQIENIRRQ